MFKSQNFCHVASNNRNNVKAGVFIYRTTDDLATVTASGYFNERIIDINLHDLIIHEKIDASDNTKVERNVLCVTERTLSNVGTIVVKSKWEGDIEQEIANFDNIFLKLDGTNTMTGVLKMRASVSFECAIAPYWHGVGLYQLNDNDSVTLLASMEATDGWCPSASNTYNMGSTYHKWKNLYLAGKAYMATINNGGDIVVPTSAGTLALMSDVAFKSTDVELTTPSAGQFLRYDGTKWVNSSDAYATTKLDNLTDTGKNIANWSSNVTNCITEIPQDIKLELNNGTLTLKAGSKVYMPNGAGVFAETTIPNDSPYQFDSGRTGTYLIYNSTDFIDLTNNVSGATDPKAGVAWHIWYDTTNNLIKLYGDDASTPLYNLSFPVGVATVSSGVVTSVQTFNGFGYIGSSVFALPNIKWLTADGRNVDGTLKSIEHTNTTVLTTDYPYNDNLCFFMTSLGVFTASKYVRSETEPTTQYTIWYKPSENILRTKGTGDWSVVNDRIVFARSQTSTTGIVSFNPIQAFHAVEYNSLLDLENYVNTLDSQNVKVTGNQSISGTKTFTGYNNKFDHYLIVDEIVNAALKAAVSLETVGSNTNVVLRAISPDGNRSGSLNLVCANGGSSYATAPHQVLGGNGNILTTYNFYWGTNGWYKLGNGLILQWGWCDTRFSTSRTITFPTAFSSTNYVVSAIPFIVANLGVYQLGFSDRTTTTVNINSSGAANDYEFAWLAIGY